MSERLKPADPAPELELPDDTGRTVDLAALRGRKVIVYFYPAAMTPGCSTQAREFTDSLEGLREHGYEVLGVSPDSPTKLARFREEEHLGIVLLSDPEKETMRRWGAFGEKTSYGRLVQGVIRSTVVVDEQGVVTHAFYNVKATGHVAKLRRDLGLA